MLRTNFQKMAQAIEALADGEIEETRAHILIGALETAHDHDVGAVRAFANGCDDNDYAAAMRPRMMMFMTREDAAHIRRALLCVFEDSAEAAWAQWPHNNMAARGQERAGLERFLACKSKSRVTRLDYFAA